MRAGSLSRLDLKDAYAPVGQGTGSESLDDPIEMRIAGPLAIELRTSTYFAGITA